MRSTFWAGKRVLVTGHTGFKGSWLSLWLGRLGAEVVGYSLPAIEPSLFGKAGLAGHMTSIEADVRDLDRLRSVFASEKPDIVFHLAAQAIVRDSYTDPAGTFSSNVMGTVNVLEAVRGAPSVSAAVMITTDKVYENREWLWAYREVDALGGHDPYSNSKACCELAISCWRRSFFAEGGARVASARAGNVIGGGDWARDRLVPDILRALTEGRKVVIRNPKSIRPWQHVLEPLHGYLVLAEALAKGATFEDPTFNFGPAEDDARPVDWMVDAICRRWGEGAGWQLDEAFNPHEAKTLRLDCSRARAELGWRPAVGLAEALDWIVDWYRDLSNGSSALDLTLNQIERYEQRVVS